MKTTLRLLAPALLPALPAAAQQPAFRLERSTNHWNLVEDNLSSTGALFIHRAGNLPALADSPALLLETNTPLPGSSSSQRCRRLAFPTKRSFPPRTIRVVPSRNPVIPNTPPPRCRLT